MFEVLNKYFIIGQFFLKTAKTNLLTGEVIVDFHVLANEVSVLSNIAISTFLHSLPLACPVLTRAITFIILYGNFS